MASPYRVRHAGTKVNKERLEGPTHVGVGKGWATINPVPSATF